jgi:hypothetical protein
MDPMQNGLFGPTECRRRLLKANPTRRSIWHHARDDLIRNVDPLRRLRHYLVGLEGPVGPQRWMVSRLTPSACAACLTLTHVGSLPSGRLAGLAAGRPSARRTEPTRAQVKLLPRPVRRCFIFSMNAICSVILIECWFSGTLDDDREGGCNVISGCFWGA